MDRPIGPVHLSLRAHTRVGGTLAKIQVRIRPFADNCEEAAGVEEPPHVVLDVLAEPDAHHPWLGVQAKVFTGDAKIAPQLRSDKNCSVQYNACTREAVPDQRADMLTRSDRRCCSSGWNPGHHRAQVVVSVGPSSGSL